MALAVEGGGGGQEDEEEEVRDFQHGWAYACQS